MWSRKRMPVRTLVPAAAIEVQREPNLRFRRAAIKRARRKDVLQGGEAARVCSTTPAVMRMQPAQPGALRLVADEDAALGRARSTSRVGLGRRRGPARSWPRSASSGGRAAGRSRRSVGATRTTRRRTSRDRRDRSSAASSAAHGGDVQAERRQQPAGSARACRDARRARRRAAPRGRAPSRTCGRRRRCDGDRAAAMSVRPLKSA